ncbi:MULTISPECIES: acyltransferase family protein [unclassified Streptomyces]|uniref:acyltransferase family protein n=1 Tax=unclassified Streptomyces TaxID=2593676 RepID=UPI0037F6A85E
MSSTTLPQSGTGSVLSKLPSLTGMRVIAALMVFFFHIGQLSPFRSTDTADTYSSVFGQGGWVGVGFFFILSGFVLTWSSRPSDTAPRFWRRRIAKVFPNHLVTSAAALIILVLAGQSVGGWKVFPALFLLQSWFPRIEISSAANSVSWSLSCELLFYLSFPLLIRVVDRIRPNRLWYWTGAVVAAILAVPLLARLMPAQPGLTFAPVSESEFWFVYVLPPVRTLDFLLGILLARIVRHGKWIRLDLGLSMVLVAAAYVCSAHVSWTFGLVAVTALPLGLMIAAAAQADLAGSWSPLRGRTMVWLGNVSFAFYLWHKMVLTEVRRWFGGPATAWGTPGALGYIALVSAITLLLSWALYSLVEEPAMHRWGKSGRARHAVHHHEARDRDGRPVTAPARETTPMP